MTGLVSISFRDLSVEEIIEMVKTAALDSIEWGGDVHVPAGDVETAQQVGELTREAGLAVAAYGSYCRLGQEDTMEEFDKVLASAKALGAPLIRIWAGDRTLEAAEEDYVTLCSRQWRAMCEKAGDILVATEYHRNTLTQTLEGAERLLENTKELPNRTTYWQPNPDLPSEADRLEEIETLRDEISYLHVFHWPDNERRPLEEGYAIWKERIELLGDKGTFPRAYLLEFVMDDTKEQFYKDAKTLRQLMDEVTSA